MVEKTGIVVIGATFVDIKGYPLGKYRPNDRNAGRMVQVHGGVCRNVVEDIANVGAKATFVSVVDYSGISNDVLKRLERHNVNTRYVLRTEDGLGTWLAIFNEKGDVVSQISKRPNLDVLGSLLDSCGDELIAGADSVAVEIDMDEVLLEKVFSLAERYGKDVYAVVSNMSIGKERLAFLPRVKCVVCNEEESLLLFGRRFERHETALLEAGIRQEMQRIGISRVVVTMGGEGSFFIERDGECGHVLARETKVVDTTGAGDAFFAGVTVGMTYGKGFRESCDLGTGMAAAVIATQENTCPSVASPKFYCSL